MRTEQVVNDLQHIAITQPITRLIGLFIVPIPITFKYFTTVNLTSLRSENIKQNIRGQQIMLLNQIKYFNSESA